MILDMAVYPFTFFDFTLTCVDLAPVSVFPDFGRVAVDLRTAGRIKFQIAVRY